MIIIIDKQLFLFISIIILFIPGGSLFGQIMNLQQKKNGKTLFLSNTDIFTYYKI